MVIGNIEPKSVMSIFETICSIPHGSGNTKALSDWCVDFAAKRGLEHYQDELNNVIIIKEATAGYENAKPVILQGHIDMVCQQEADLAKDMSKEGLDLAVDGDDIHAIGTTLGGDDGIAVAMALAILDTDDIPHPRLEVMLTVDEETGMYGAAGIDVSAIKGKTLINIDSEEEGIFTVSCAGGARANCFLPIVREYAEGEFVNVIISGLKGGHSGVEIDKGRANATILMGRFLSLLAHGSFRILTLEGGSADNAIPLRCEAGLFGCADEIAKTAEIAEAIFKKEYRNTDAGVVIEVIRADSPCRNALDAESTQRACDLLTLVPNGIQAMSSDIPGLVETSLNLGILKLGEDTLRASFALRSSVGSRKEAMKTTLKSVLRVLGGHVEITGDYPAWEYRAESPLRDLMTEVYIRQYGEQPEVLAIHAGLECGLLSAKIPDLDCVSIGPNMKDIHTTSERMSISSVQRVWKFVLEVLKESK
ncbi:MAG: aminoacyl-histidine dipeptidase [Oscillospiraceae bacterium]|nr:aminoacyl-histidine dipeptidase [Oscillospiraceae bacterium]